MSIRISLDKDLTAQLAYKAPPPVAENCSEWLEHRDWPRIDVTLEVPQDLWSVVRDCMPWSILSHTLGTTTYQGTYTGETLRAAEKEALKDLQTLNRQLKLYGLTREERLAHREATLAQALAMHGLLAPTSDDQGTYPLQSLILNHAFG